MVRALLVLFILVSAAAIVISMAAAWYEQASAGNPLDASVGGHVDEAVRIQGHVGADRVEPGTAVDCRFVIQNTGDQAIENLRLRDFDARGFERFAASDFDPNKPEVLGARQIISFRPRRPLIAATVQQRASITAVFEWQVGNVTHQQPISLGPIAIRSATEPRIYSLSKAWVGFLKDFFLPIVLLVITTLITRQQRESETAASWNLMLPKIHEYTGHYYLPVASAASEIVSAFDRAEVAQPNTFDDLTFFLLLFRKRSRVLFERIGGFYLTTHPGERLVSVCEDAFLEALQPHVSRDVLREAKDAVGRYTELHVFRKNALGTAPVQAARAGLIAWKAADPVKAAVAVKLLDIFADVLEYEVNLTYRFWYNDPPKPPPKRAAEMTALRASGSASLAEIADDYESYLREITTRRW
jgi:hypothetical protein